MPHCVRPSTILNMLAAASPSPEEIQRNLVELREMKVDLSRQLQEANIRAYRANAELEQMRKKRASQREKPAVSGLSGQKAALEAMFSLDASAAEAEQEEDALAESELAAEAEAEAARYTLLIAEVDAQIAALSGSSGEAAQALATMAAAASSAATATGLQAKRELSAIKARKAEQAVLAAESAKETIADLRAAAESANATASAAMQRLEEFAAGQAAGGQAEGVPYASMARRAEDMQARVETFDVECFKLMEAKQAMVRNAEKDSKANLAVGLFQWLVDSSRLGEGGGGGGGQERGLEREMRERNALVEAARALGMAEPHRATEDDVRAAAAAAKARAEEEERRVAEAARGILARLGSSASSRPLGTAAASSSSDAPGLDVGAGGLGGEASVAPQRLGEGMEDYLEQQSREEQRLVREGEDAEAAFEAAVTEVAAAGDAGTAEEEVLAMELRVRELKAAANEASAAAADAKGASLRAAQEVQASLAQAATIAVTAATAANDKLRGAEDAASAAVAAAARAMAEADQAKGAVDEAEADAS